MKDYLNAIEPAVRAKAASHFRGWEWRTDLQAALWISRLAGLPGMIAYIKSVDAGCLINTLIYGRRSTQVAPAERDIVEARGGDSVACAGKGLTWLRKEMLQRRGEGRRK